MIKDKINIAEILKNCPMGMELDCTMFDNVEFECIDEDNISYPIRCRIKNEFGSYNIHNFTKYGCGSTEVYSKCVIFPKGKTTWEGWEGFVPYFKDGDIITDVKESNPFIFHYDNGEFYDVHCGLINDYLQIYKRKNDWVSNRRKFRYATEEEKKRLFDALKKNGYKWNPETKILEKQVEPIFKVGDKIKHKEETKWTCTIARVEDRYYVNGHPTCFTLPFDKQDEYELIPNKFDITTFKPFESRVLVRDVGHNEWEGAVFGRYDGNSFFTIGGIDWKYCIPYEGNEHLLGTNNDCSEYYKFWQ